MNQKISDRVPFDRGKNIRRRKEAIRRVSFWSGYLLETIGKSQGMPFEMYQTGSYCEKKQFAGFQCSVLERTPAKMIQTNCVVGLDPDRDI